MSLPNNNGSGGTQSERRPQHDDQRTNSARQREQFLAKKHQRSNRNQKKTNQSSIFRIYNVLAQLLSCGDQQQSHDDRVTSRPTLTKVSRHRKFNGRTQLIWKDILNVIYIYVLLLLDHANRCSLYRYAYVLRLYRDALHHRSVSLFPNL